MAWDQLVSIISEAASIDDQDASTAPESCSTCYTPLVGTATGGLYCPWDGQRWPEDASAWGPFPGAF